MRLLLIIPYAPTPIRTRPFNFIRFLAMRGNLVTVATLWSSSEEQAQLAGLEQLGVRVIGEPLTRKQSMWNLARHAVNRAPAQAAYCWQPALAQRIRSLIASHPLDAIHVEHLRGAWYGLDIQSAQRNSTGVNAQTPVIWDSVDSISHLFGQARAHSAKRSSRWIAALELPRTRAYEKYLAAQFAQTLVVSSNERDAYMALLGEAPQNPNRSAAERVSVVPNGVDLEYFAPQTVTRDPATILFTGKMSYHANVTAALFLIDEILPLVQSHVPQARVIIAGQNPPPTLRARASSSVEITGTVPDLRPYLARATAACAPIVYGAGIQNKILEAMAMGLATVTTPAALEGLQAQPNRDLLIGDNAAGLSAAIFQLIRDPIQRKTLEQNGRTYVAKHHQWTQSVEQLERIYQAAPRYAAA